MMKQAKNDPPGRLPPKPHRVIALSVVEADTNVIDEERMHVKQQHPPTTSPSNFSSAVSIGSSMHSEFTSLAEQLASTPETHTPLVKSTSEKKQHPLITPSGAVSVASSPGGVMEASGSGGIGIFNQHQEGSSLSEDEAKDGIANLFNGGELQPTSLHPVAPTNSICEVSVASSTLLDFSRVDKRSRSGETVYSTQPMLQKSRSNPASPQAPNVSAPPPRHDDTASIGNFNDDSYNNSIGIATLRCLESSSSSIGPTTVSSLTRAPSRVTFTRTPPAARERSASDHEVTRNKPTHRRATSADLIPVDVRKPRHRRSTSDCQLSLLTEDMGNVSVARRRKSPPGSVCIVPLIVDTDADSDSNAVESLDSIEPLLELLEIHQSDATAANLLLDELFDRAVCEDCELIQRAPDVVTTVSKVMESNLDNADLQHRALGLLVQLLEHPDYSAGGSAELIAQIMTVVGQHHEECTRVICAGFWCLRLLLTSKNGRHVEHQATAASDITVVLKAMHNHAEDASVQQQGISVLAALSNGHPENTARILKANGMKIIVDTMTRHVDDPSVQKWGCVGLASLLNHHDGVVERMLSDGESHAAIVEAMRLHELHAEVQGEACLGLAAHVNSQSHAKLSANKTHSTRHGNPEVLSKLCVSEDEQEIDSPSSFRSSGGIEGIVRAMYIHEENAIVQQRGSFSLGVYSSRHYQTEVSDAAGMEAIVHAMKTHKQNAEVQQWGCFALGHLCDRHSSNQAAIVGSMKGFHLVLDAMRRHKESEGLQAWGCFALEKFADDNSESALNK